MPQLSLYLDEDSMEKVREEADRKDTTLSKYVSEVLHEYEDKTHLWPEGFFDLYGACDDETFVEPPDIPFELDAPRLTL